MGMSLPLALVLGAGLGVFNNFQPEASALKQLEIGLEERLHWIDLKTSWGYYFDDTGYHGAHDSWYVCETFDLGPRFTFLNIGASFGIAYLGRPDTVNSSSFEFAPGAEATIIDNRNVQVGAYFEHFSNAGLLKPNLGRSFLGIRIKL
jgi:hypothetical protein